MSGVEILRCWTSTDASHPYLIPRRDWLIVTRFILVGSIL